MLCLAITKKECFDPKKEEEREHWLNKTRNPKPVKTWGVKCHDNDNRCSMHTLVEESWAILCSEEFATAVGTRPGSPPDAWDMNGMIWWSKLDKNSPSSVTLGSASCAPTTPLDVLAWSDTEPVVNPSALPSSTWISPPGKRFLINCKMPLGICLSDSWLFWVPPADKMLTLTLRAIDGSCLKLGVDPAGNRH